MGFGRTFSLFFKLLALKFRSGLPTAIAGTLAFPKGKNKNKNKTKTKTDFSDRSSQIEQMI